MNKGTYMKHKLTVVEQVHGLKSALRNRRTPAHLRPFIKKRIRELEPKLKRERAAQRRRRRPGLLDFLGL